MKSSAHSFAKKFAVVAIATLALLAAQHAGAQGALEEVTGFGSNPGNLRMYKYIPAELVASPPLVVALHGCQQTAASFDDETGWVKLADQFGFALMLPEQKGLVLGQPTMTALPVNPALPEFPLPLLDVNNYLGCFNWFEPGDTARGEGEALSIEQMVDRMKADYSIDSSRVFITGLSAGGAMAAVMLATYPEVFAAGAIVAGLPYKCASTPFEAQFGCMNPGKDLTPSAWGDRVRAATSHSGPWPKISIWQGTGDTRVNPMNARELMEQWTNVHGIDQTPDQQDVVKRYPHQVFKDAGGTALVETYMITGMGHGDPVDPGPAADQCGIAGGFILDVDICSSFFIAKFWGLAP
jgi:poly(hydroxyalkanoate) depolymerase family esterase